MTPPALQFIVENFERFCQWFERPEIPDYAWQQIREDFAAMKPGVEYLIERERARLQPPPPPPIAQNS